jgi:hypothetical protein
MITLKRAVTMLTSLMDRSFYNAAQPSLHLKIRCMKWRGGGVVKEPTPSALHKIVSWGTHTYGILRHVIREERVSSHLHGIVSNQEKHDKLTH